MDDSIKSDRYGKNASQVWQSKSDWVWWIITNTGNRISSRRNLSVFWGIKKGLWRFNEFSIILWEIPWQIHQEQV